MSDHWLFGKVCYHCRQLIWSKNFKFSTYRIISLFLKYLILSAFLVDCINYSILPMPNFCHWYQMYFKIRANFFIFLVLDWLKLLVKFRVKLMTDFILRKIVAFHMESSVNIKPNDKQNSFEWRRGISINRIFIVNCSTAVDVITSNAIRCKNGVKYNRLWWRAFWNELYGCKWIQNWISPLHCWIYLLISWILNWTFS